MGDTSGNNEGLRTYRQAVAIVTGGGSGIGAALGRGLAARGAHVVLADRDVREAADVERVVARALDAHGRLDYLFNNAGVAVGGEALDLSLEDWRYAVEVNLMGPIHGVQAAYSRMVKQGFGHIVNTRRWRRSWRPRWPRPTGRPSTPFTASRGPSVWRGRTTACG